MGSCVNDNWYHTDVRYNHTLFYELLGFVMNATRTNWLFPRQPGYFDIGVFNLTYSFHLDLLNSTIFHGTMQICLPPPAPTQPPMLSGGENGWNVEGMTRIATGGARSTCCPLGTSFQLGAL